MSGFCSFEIVQAGMDSLFHGTPFSTALNLELGALDQPAKCRPSSGWNVRLNQRYSQGGCCEFFSSVGDLSCSLVIGLV